MTRKCISLWSLSACFLLAIAGCASRVSVPPSAVSRILADVRITEPDFNEVIASGTDLGAVSPFSVRDSDSPQWEAPQAWDLTVDQAIQLALANSTVLRDLGARVIQTPGLTPTIYGPAIQATDANGGVEAALSEFDARINGDLFQEDNNRVLNNEFSGSGENFFTQELTRLQASLSKQTVSGSLLTLRHNLDAELNNSDRNLLGLNRRAFNWNFEGEIRQPLLQGRGVTFNRIAGPNATPGVYSGVVIARLNADVTVAQLEIALRDYLSDVENAYWDLQFAYADLDVKKEARDRSLNTYLLLKARQGLPGAEDDKLAQAKEQYFRFEQEVQNSLAGRLVVGTRAFNGSGGGTFQGTGGVFVNERRLRLIMGIPINDGRLIHPSSIPQDAPITYDWNDSVSHAIARRTELRSQRLIVERRGHELTASRNFLMPRLDAVGRYRYRALGEGWFDHNVLDGGTPTSTGTHEWLMGLSLSYPVGFRQAHSAVRNAQLRLARERAMLTELERQVVYGLSNAIAESDRAFATLRTALNRENAAKEQYDILAGEAKGLVRQFDFNSLLDSEQRYAEAASAAIRAKVQYSLATKNLNFEMGTLLEYYNIHLTETQSMSSVTTSGPGKRLIRSVVDMAKTPWIDQESPSGAEPTFSATTPSADLQEAVFGESTINRIIERELAFEETLNGAVIPDQAIESPSDLVR